MMTTRHLERSLLDAMMAFYSEEGNTRAECFFLGFKHGLGGKPSAGHVLLDEGAEGYRLGYAAGAELGVSDER